MATKLAWGATPSAVAAPYEYLIVDIETANAPAADIDAWFDREYTPPSNYKDPEKIRAHREDAFSKAHQRAALLPSAPVIAIGLKSESELRCLHCMKEHAPALRQVGGQHALVEGFQNMSAMLAAFTTVCEHRVAETTIFAGFNVRDFDFPALRRALARSRMPLPAALLNPEQPTWDNMVKYCRLYSGRSEIMASCAEVSEALGITPHRVSGAVVPDLFEAKEFETIVDKCLLDCLEEENQFRRMTGRQEGQR